MPSPQSSLQLIPADWPAAKNIVAFTSSRELAVPPGGQQQAYPYGGANMALHVGDDPARVSVNRLALMDGLPPGSQLNWLQQVHGCDVRRASRASSHPEPPAADGWYSAEAGQALAIMSADCLPLLICNRAGDEIAALHAGWRGVAGSILSHALTQFSSAPADLLLWIGPGISMQHFTVGADVKEQLERSVASLDSADCFSTALEDGSCNANLAALVRLQAGMLGFSGVYGGDWCSYSDSRRFYSYRREPVTGRNVTVIVRGQK